MKTNQLILAAAIIAIAGCTKSNVETNVNAESNEIGFNAVTRVATKANNAIVTGTTYGTDNTFKVWGWWSEAKDYSEFSSSTDSNFMSNLTISYTKGRDGSESSRSLAWRNADNYYYWPMVGEISFLAIHPSDFTPTSTAWDATNEKPMATKTGYTITADNKTTDLMFATNKGERQAAALPLVFKHALSQIEVKVKTYDDYSSDVQFDVKSVVFNNIALSGDVTFANGAISWANNDTQTGSWTYCNTTLENVDDNLQVYGAANVMIPQAANIDASALETTDPAYDANDDDETTITITYTMQPLPASSADPINGTVTVAAPQAWVAGSKYVYTVVFNLYEILFSPSVDPEWVTVNVDSFNI